METFAYVVVTLIILAVVKVAVSPFKPPKGFHLDRHGNICCRVCGEQEHNHAPDPCPEQQELF